jgi:hypothetical protein
MLPWITFSHFWNKRNQKLCLFYRPKPRSFYSKPNKFPTAFTCYTYCIRFFYRPHLLAENPITNFWRNYHQALMSNFLSSFMLHFLPRRICPLSHLNINQLTCSIRLCQSGRECPLPRACGSIAQTVPRIREYGEHFRSRRLTASFSTRSHPHFYHFRPWLMAAAAWGGIHWIVGLRLVAAILLVVPSPTCLVISKMFN